MSSPDTIRFQAAAELVRNALSRKLYPDPIAIVVEMITNGMDGATRADREPEIDVWFWAPGEHPLSQDGPAISVTDNGTGFTPEVLADFGMVGRSAHEGDKRFHGTHGMGKLASFGLSDDENPVIFITTSTDGERMLTYRIAATDVFSGKPIQGEPITDPRPKMPEVGSFTEVLVANFNGTVKVEDLRNELTNRLPIRPWTVRVQGQEVAQRDFTPKVQKETPRIPALGSEVVFGLTTAEITEQEDDVLLIDADTGRIVTSLRQLPAGARKQLKPELLDLRLQAEIRVSGLEEASSVGRGGMSSSFWGSPKGALLIRVLNGFVAPEAAKLLESSAGPRDKLHVNLSKVAESFARTFGGEVPDPKPKGGSGGKGSKGGSGGGGGRRRRGGNSNPAPTAQDITIRVQDTDYKVMSFRAKSPMPAEVREGGFLVINTASAMVKRLRGSSAPVMRQGLIRAIIEAHVHATADRSDPGFNAFEAVHTLEARVLS